VTALRSPSPGKTGRDFGFRRITLEDALAGPEAERLFPE